MIKTNKDVKGSSAKCGASLMAEMLGEANSTGEYGNLEFITTVSLNPEEHKLAISTTTIEGVKISDVMDVPNPAEVRTMVDKIEISAVEKLPKKDRYDRDTELPDGDIKHTPSGTIQKVTITFDNSLSVLKKVRILRENLLGAMQYFLQKYKEQETDNAIIDRV